MVKKFAIASHHLRGALKIVVGWVRIEPRADAISHTNRFVMFSSWETQRNAVDALHYKHQLNSHLAKGQCLIEQFTTYLLKGELGRRTDMRRQDQIPNSIIHSSIYLPSIESVLYWNQHQRYLWMRKKSSAEQTNERSEMSSESTEWTEGSLLISVRLSRIRASEKSLYLKMASCVWKSKLIHISFDML